MTTTCELLTVEDVAGELTLSPVEARRLVALKTIPATRLGDDGSEWRVTVESVVAYVKAGAKQLRLPEYDDNEWFDNKLTTLANSFGTAVIDAAEEQVPINDVLRRNCEQAKQESMDYPIKNIGKVGELLRSAVPVAYINKVPQFTGAPGTPASRFKLWADLYAVDLLRNMAYQLLTAKIGDGQSGPLSRLYDSPEGFQSITRQAYSEASKRRIVFSKAVGGVNPKVFNSVMPVNCRASFLFPVSTFMYETARDYYVKLAF